MNSTVHYGLETTKRISYANYNKLKTLYPVWLPLLQWMNLITHGTVFCDTLSGNINCFMCGKRGTYMRLIQASRKTYSVAQVVRPQIKLEGNKVQDCH